jgi:hypothetical protein
VANETKKAVHNKKNCCVLALKAQINKMFTKIFGKTIDKTGAK